MIREIKLTISTPEGVDCTEQEFQQWVRYITNYSSYISIANPLRLYGLEPDDIDIPPC